MEEVWTNVAGQEETWKVIASGEKSRTPDVVPTQTRNPTVLEGRANIAKDLQKPEELVGSAWNQSKFPIPVVGDVANTVMSAANVDTELTSNPTGDAMQGLLYGGAAGAPVGGIATNTARSIAGNTLKRTGQHINKPGKTPSPLLVKALGKIPVVGKPTERLVGGAVDKLLSPVSAKANARIANAQIDKMIKSGVPEKEAIDIVAEIMALKSKMLSSDVEAKGSKAAGAAIGSLLGGTANTPE